MTADPNKPANDPESTRISTPRGAAGGAGDTASDESTRFIPALHFRTGEMILARYRLKKPLGRGGFGVVWRATDENLHIDVAIKFLAPEIVHNPEAIEDLKQKTRYSLRLTHPNIVRIHAAAYASLWQSMDGDERRKIERAFQQFSAQSVELAVNAIEIDASRATARFSEKRKLTPVVGSPLTQERNVSMKLERADDGPWRIVSMN
jgi:Protein tyrosine and serine/threonine kinase